MTAPTAMSREEMIELAAMDALGLLDEFEAAMYTRAFLSAPESIQQELRELQAQVAADPAFMSDELPDESLRDRVLAAINDAIEAEDAKLAPIASIGRRLNRPGHADAEPRYRLLLAARFWRAACFALCGALVVVSYFLAEQTAHNNDFGRIVLSNYTAEQIEEMIGPSVKDYLRDDDARLLRFQSTDPASDIWAVLMIRENGSAFLVTEGLALTDQPEYSLKMADRRGTLHDVAQFDNINRLAGREIVAANHRAASRWEIHGPDGVVLTSIV